MSDLICIGTVNLSSQKKWQKAENLRRRGTWSIPRRFVKNSNFPSYKLVKNDKKARKKSLVSYSYWSEKMDNSQKSKSLGQQSSRMLMKTQLMLCSMWGQFDIMYYELLKPHEHNWWNWAENWKKNTPTTIPSPVKTYLDTLNWEALPVGTIAHFDVHLFRPMVHGLPEQYLKIPKIWVDLWIAFEDETVSVCCQKQKKVVASDKLLE